MLFGSLFSSIHIHWHTPFQMVSLFLVSRELSVAGEEDLVHPPALLVDLLADEPEVAIGRVHEVLVVAWNKVEQHGTWNRPQ